MMSKIIVSSIVVVCLVALVNSAQLKVNRRLERGYLKMYGGVGKPVVWQEIAKMSQQQLAQICKDVHVLTNYGPLQDSDLKEVKVEDAYLEFSNSKSKTPTQVLSCKKNNKEQYVYYLTKALAKDSAMLVYVSKTTKPINGKNVFTFTGHNQISRIPALQ